MRSERPWSVLSEENRWVVHSGSRAWLVYLLRGAATKPYISMLPAPSGRNLLADAPSDHLHHHGIWWAHGDVNGVDFYLETPGAHRGRIVHREWLEVTETPDRVGFVERLSWKGPDGREMIEEVRRIRLTRGWRSGLLLELESVYRALEDLRFGTTKESGIPLIRMADAFTGRAGGRIENSEGQQGEEATFGRPARWVSYTAPVPEGYGGGWEGLTCFDHPSNPHHPTCWFTREYGPLSPREGHHFTGEERLAAGETLRLRHGIYVHRGAPADLDLESAFSEYVSLAEGSEER
ncbi:MAG: hypothetical protein KatS3mg115_1045 [Candidatus Poribacteria bacterium]|nr:MAG: hypothetical protein KatS3mg115_1045 [Candidatus Poribacteria bacterium]